jgi:Fe2+ or Zn2+ uptake regulation protein
MSMQLPVLDWPEMKPPHHQALIDAILAYLSHHPQAADSADGVTRWWLARNGSGPSRLEVERALTKMVERGLLRSVELPDGTVLYSCDGSARH